MMIKILENKLKIRPRNKVKAINLIKTLYLERDIICGVKKKDVDTARTFEEIMCLFGYEITQTNSEDYSTICRNAYKQTDDAVIFNIIAPCVEDESYIVMCIPTAHGEERDYVWTWYFQNGKLLKKEGKYIPEHKQNKDKKEDGVNMKTKNKLSEKLAMLEALGFDTSMYNVVINGNKVEITGIAHQVVEDKQIENKAFRRWIAAQTFKMLDPSFSWGTRKQGWDAYLRNHYAYDYQFTMLAEELKTLAKLENRDKTEFEERSNFFTKGVVVATCKDYINKFTKYYNIKKDKNGVCKLQRYGKVDKEQFNAIKEEMYDIVNDINDAKSYGDIYTCFEKFMKAYNKLPFDTAKCSAWKEAFKGSGAYYTLKNIILYHGVLLDGCRTKDESMEMLNELLGLYHGNVWKFHYLLKDTIAINNFSLKESIAKQKKL